ncbi:hypothetical protein ZHAS_00010493 [Anopheles sinensis]|uniref:Uncharacterized protein n=1 Tax=Anopheles sinensis TaxID=74873 RepID=A0A084VXQ2_ANOSI|nr:hypothetical protein ZHAS_00010493 [Anopheles sinensis]
MLADHAITTMDLQVTKQVQSATMPPPGSPVPQTGTSSSGGTLSSTLRETSFQQPVPTIPSASLVAGASHAHNIESKAAPTLTPDTVFVSTTAVDMLDFGTQSSRHIEIDSLS